MKTIPYVYALLGDKRAADAADQALGHYGSEQLGPITNTRLVRALSLVRVRDIDDGLGLATEIVTSMPLSAARRRITGQIINALPVQARALPAAQELRERAAIPTPAV